MAIGTVKWFSDAKGYGFIQPDAQGADIFAHFSAINMSGFKTLKPGERVSYELHDGPKGLHALLITPLAEDGQAIPAIVTSDQAAAMPVSPMAAVPNTGFAPATGSA